MIDPIAGGDGVAGWELITTFAEAGDVHPIELVTVKVYVPEGIPEMITVVPLPEFVAPPGFRVTVQMPVDGNPLNVTVPVATEQVG